MSANDTIQFAILGLGTGAIYALLGQGIIVIYRGSGIVNFAQGAMAMVGAFVFWDLHFERGWSYWPAFVVGVAFVAVIGALTHLLVMRPMRRSSPLARLIATLGLLSILTAAATLQWGGLQQIVTSSLPQDLWTLNNWGLDVTVSSDRIYILAIAVGLTIVLTVVYRFTLFGIGVSAAAENERAASALGWSPDFLATINWTIGGALAAVGGILVVPLTGLQVNQLTLIVIAALAAALAGGFSSFPITLVGGLAIGIVQSELARYGADLFGATGQQGVSASLPFAAIVVILVIRGKALPIRSHVGDKLPRIGSGVIRPLPIVATAAIVAAGTLTIFNEDVITALLAMTLAAVIILSLVVVTGYAGQVSLGQFALAGMGAFAAGRLVAARGWPFEAAFVAGVIVAALVGLVFALPALRTRGVNLAVVTLGLGLAFQQILFSNGKYTGNIDGTHVGKTSVFGVSIDGVAYKERYLLFSLFWFSVVCLAVANLRRGRAGRRLIAVRANERAAASLGISVFGSKLYAFVVSAGIAGLGGILIGFQHRYIIYTSYDPFASINSVLQAVIGGIGYVLGAFFGAQLAPGALGDLIVEQFVAEPGQWLVLAGGVLVVVLLIVHPDGIASVAARAWETAPPSALNATATRRGCPHESHAGHPRRPRPVRTDRFRRCCEGRRPRRGARSDRRADRAQRCGQDDADRRSHRIREARGGSILLGRVSITGWPAARRARAGITRTFQSLELFEDVTVRENLQAAADSRDLHSVRDRSRLATSSAVASGGGGSRP